MTKYDNSGSISKNKYKKKEDQPDITGDAIINGVNMRVAGWHKIGSKGPFYSLLFKLKEEKTDQIDQNGDQGNMDDEIPF